MNGALYKNNYLGLPSFIMNALNAFTITIVNLFLVAYIKIQQLIIMTINGLIQGCLPIMRFNYGAGNLKRLQLVFRYSTILVTSLMLFGTLIIMLFPTQILSLFMALEKMRSYGIIAMRIMATGYLLCGLSTSQKEVVNLLRQTVWAKERKKEVINKS